MKKLLFIISFLIFTFTSCKTVDKTQLPNGFEDAEMWFDSVFCDLKLGNEGITVFEGDTIIVKTKKIDGNIYFFPK